MDAALTTKIMNEVDHQFDDQTKVLADLVKIPSTRFREAPAQDMMARLFKEDGLGVDRWQIKIDDLKHLPGYSPHSQDYDDAWNVVGAWPERCGQHVARRTVRDGRDQAPCADDVCHAGILSAPALLGVDERA